MLSSPSSSSSVVAALNFWAWLWVKLLSFPDDGGTYFFLEKLQVRRALILYISLAFALIKVIGPCCIFDFPRSGFVFLVIIVIVKGEVAILSGFLPVCRVLVCNNGQNI